MPIQLWLALRIYIYIYIYIYSIRFAKPGGLTKNIHAWRIQTLFIKSKRSGIHHTFYNLVLTFRSPGVHFLIILGSKWRLETTLGPKWSQRASQTEKVEILTPRAHESLPPFFCFFRFCTQILYFLGMCFSGTVSLPFLMDSWTLVKPEIMPKHCRVERNQGFAHLGKVWFQIPFGVHFGVILETLWHQSLTFSGFVGCLLFASKMWKFGT